MRRLIRDISSVLIVSGLLLVLDAGVTLVWQEPVTAAIGTIKRGQLDTRYMSRPLDQLSRHALASLTSTPDKIAFLAREEQRAVPAGSPIGELSTPKLGTYPVVQGTGIASLERGPGHYPLTGFPGLGQTVGIAGHRTTYLAPFRHLDALKPGDRIVLKMPYADFTYVVQSSKIVLPNAVWVVDNVGYERLVLSACNPLYSASQRIVVFARLTHVHPTAEASVAA